MSSETFLSKGIQRDVLDVARGESPVLVSFPHSGDIYPDDFGFDPALSFEQIDFPSDKYVDQLFIDGTALDITKVKANFPRAYIDVNRHQHDIDIDMFTEGSSWYGRLLPGSVSVGATLFWSYAGPNKIYARQLTTAEAKQRLANFFIPYHQTMTRLIEELRDRHGNVYIVDCHSMTQFDNKLRGGKRRPDIDIGTRRGGSCAPDLAEQLVELFTARGYDAGIDKRFVGGEITLRYGWPELGQHCLQIELRRDLYMNEATRARTENFSKVKADCTEILKEFKAYVETRKINT